MPPRKSNRFLAAIIDTNQCSESGTSPSQTEQKQFSPPHSAKKERKRWRERDLESEGTARHLLDDFSDGTVHPPVTDHLATGPTPRLHLIKSQSKVITDMLGYWKLDT